MCENIFGLLGEICILYDEKYACAKHHAKKYDCFVPRAKSRHQRRRGKRRKKVNLLRAGFEPTTYGCPFSSSNYSPPLYQLSYRRKTCVKPLEIVYLLNQTKGGTGGVAAGVVGGVGFVERGRRNLFYLLLSPLSSSFCCCYTA